MTPLAQDEPITFVPFVHSGQPGRILHGRVLHPHTGFETVLEVGVPSPINNARMLLSATSEGKRWIRGHHDPESEEAHALLAAFALTRTDT